MKTLLKGILTSLVIAVLLLGVAFVALPLPGQIPILMYHFLGTDEDAAQSSNFVSAESFSHQMKFLKQFGYRVISMDEYYEIWVGQRKARGREILLTFDDGNYTFDTLAYPILSKYKFPVTVFIIGENVQEVQYGSMTEETIRRLGETGWITFASHSRRHPFLTEVDEEERKQEIRGSKKDFEEMFGKPFYYFSYPYGNFSEETMEEVQEAGYRLAFTTSPKKTGHIQEVPYSITRTKMTQSADNLFIYWVKVSGVYGFFKKLRHQWKMAVT